MIRIDLITIFQAINNEYGTDELIKRIKNILKIDLTNLIGIPTIIEFSHNKVIITNEKTKVRHIIELDSEYYTYTKDFNTHYITKYYDLNKLEFRKLAAITTSDDELLIIDEINEEEMVTRRITKTTKEDTDFLHGSFEKEQHSLKEYNTQERYRFIEDLSCNRIVSKEIEMPGNLYVYSYRSTENALSINYCYGYIESSACIDKPQVLTAGRIRENTELLINSVKTPVPNILIRGRNVIPSDETEIDLYNINIYKIDDDIQVIINIVNLPRAIQSREEHIIKSSTSGEITIADINQLIEYISTNIDASLSNEIKKELLNIKKQILVKKRKEIRDLDFFDGRFLMFKEFEYLVYDAYENLAYYEEIINKLTRKGKDDNPPTLKIT